MTTAIAPDELMTVEQVADLLRLTPRTVRNRIKDNLLPARKTRGGRDWRIRRADALALLEEPPPSPLQDRLGTPAGRAHALAVLAQLGEEGDADEQRAAWEQLHQALADHPLGLRPWDPETGDLKAADLKAADRREAA